MPISDDKTFVPSDHTQISSRADFARPGTVLGEYKITALIGEGALGRVFKAYQGSLQRYVAIKILKNNFSYNQNFILSFKKEAQHAAKLQHPNIVQIYGIGEEKETHYFIMELVNGKTLKELIKEKKRSFVPSKRFFNCHDAILMIQQIAEGLRHAHENGIIHKDIKPSNIIREDNTKRMMIGDFGLARALETTPESSQNNFTGTPLYMAPELFSGGPGNVKTDLYALGATFFELLTGSPPYKEKTLKKLTEKILHEPFIDPRKVNPAIPPEISSVVIKCLNKKPEGRYKTTQEFIQDLSLFLNEGRTLAFEESHSISVIKKTSAFHKKKKNTGVYIAIAAAGFILISGIVAFMNIYLPKNQIRMKDDHCRKQLEIARNYFRLNREDLAAPVLLEIVQEYPLTQSAFQAKQIADEVCKKHLEMAINYTRMKRNEIARQVLNDMKKNYPYSSYAEQAEETLKEMEY